MTQPRDAISRDNDDQPMDRNQNERPGRPGVRPAGGGRQATDQPAGVPDRTRRPDEALPRDVDEGDGRNPY
ncbi:hypothetical protein [Phreatobacter sp.]|uniref:hypothetical protein n=1 Tax=Phreatobacter sp. TaxID=1966341 RepID=UPI0025D47BFF|nr:hypothetical protein [Phreatobacter sp.]